MAATKDYFDKIMENQNKLVTSVTDYANEAIDTVLPDPAIAEKTESLVKEYFDVSTKFAEDFGKKENVEKFQEDFWGTMTESYNQGIKLSASLYEKTMVYVKDLWSGTTMENQQEKMKKFSEMYQDYWKTCMDVTKENTKVMQDFLKDTTKTN